MRGCKSKLTVDILSMLLAFVAIISGLWLHNEVWQLDMYNDIFL